MLKHRAGARIGHDTAYDYMFLDGLEDAYETDRAMGSFVEETARAYQFTREAMDEYAISSLTRARAAAKSGAFKKVIVPVVVVPGRGGAVTVSDDEQPLKAYSTKISTLKPAFAKDGAITAANAPSISDGAAALVITRQSVAKQLGMNVVARIVAHGAHAHEPGQLTTAPVPAIQKTLKRAGWSIEDVDLFEVNEPFACVAMIAKRDLHPRDKLNVNGVACALGHPICASDARIIATLLAALEARGGRKGIASLCIGGGEATAVVVELV